LGGDDLLLIKGRPVNGGVVSGRALVAKMPFGFWQGLDPYTGKCIDRRHDAYGKEIGGTVFVFPFGRGSTGTPGIFLEAVKMGNAPVAMINVQTEPLIAISAILADIFFGIRIPVIDGCAEAELEAINEGDLLYIDGYKGTIMVGE